MKEQEYEEPTDECYSKPNAICPHCGGVDHDTWEHGMNDDESMETQCGYCDKEYLITCSFDISYTTRKRKENDK